MWASPHDGVLVLSDSMAAALVQRSESRRKVNLVECRHCWRYLIRETPKQKLVSTRAPLNKYKLYTIFVLAGVCAIPLDRVYQTLPRSEFIAVITADQCDDSRVVREWHTDSYWVIPPRQDTESYRHDKMPHTAQTASNSSRAQCWGTIPSQTIINSIFFSKNVRILLFSIKKKDRPTPFPFPFVKRISIFSRRLLEQCQTFACKQVLC